MHVLSKNKCLEPFPSYAGKIWCCYLEEGTILHLTFCQGENKISVAKERIRAYLCSIILYLYKKKGNHSIFLYLCREYD